MLGQVASLARRSVLRIVRQPAEVVPALTFPLIFLALISGGATAASNIPGFPAERYLDFALAAVLIQGAVLGGVNAGAGLAIDVEEGFINRLSLTPMRRPALLVGHLSGSMVVGVVQGTIFVVVATVFEVDFRTGLVGAAILVALNVLVSLAFSAVGAIIAVRTASSVAVQAIFPLFFIILSFSSFFMPRELISADWFRYVANANPSSYIIEGARSLVISGWDAGMILTGFGAAFGVAVLAIAAASASLRTVMTRT